MPKVSRFVHVVACAALLGCGLASVSPLIDGSDVEHDARFLGTWGDSAGKESAVIVADGNRYDITYYDSDGKVGRYHAVLGRLGGRRALDVTPKDPGAGASDFYRSLLLPLHGLLFVDAIDTLLVFRAIESDSVKKFLQARPGAVAHVVRENGIVITAPTADARRFLADMIARPGVLGGPEVWRRRK